MGAPDSSQLPLPGEGSWEVEPQQTPPIATPLQNYDHAHSTQAMHYQWSKSAKPRPLLGKAPPLKHRALPPINKKSRPPHPDPPH